MNPTFHRFVERIVKQTDGNQMEKEDLYEELMIHLEMSSEQFIQEGFTEKSAERKAMEHFGNAEEIGSQIQQAMFPFRKEMLLTLAVASIICSFSIYLAWLIIESHAVIGWLVISMITSSCLFVTAVRPTRYLNRRIWLNTLLIIHVFLYVYGALLASGIDYPVAVALTPLSWLIILLGIVLLYLTTLSNYQPSKHRLHKQFRMLHILNLTVGIILVCATLFFCGGFWFFPEKLLCGCSLCSSLYLFG